VRATYLYSLSNFAGKLPYSFPRIVTDFERDETYILYGNLVRVFNASGMEVFSFGDGLDVGMIVDAAVERSGGILLLTYKDSRAAVVRCNFRGVPVGTLEIRGLPAGVVFEANGMVSRNGSLYFLSQREATVIVTDGDGAFRERIDLLSQVEAEPREREGAEVIGFAVDQGGNIFFTVPVMFRVFKLSPDRKLTSFGKAGSRAGQFGVVAGVATDSRGNLLVADKLKCVIMAFDEEFRFLGEFGYRGPKPENLVVPDAIALDRRDRLYVSQGRDRGISVFALRHDTSRP
jgi:sugar lactone lactonase YvrE